MEEREGGREEKVGRGGRGRGGQGEGREGGAWQWTRGVMWLHVATCGYMYGLQTTQALKRHTPKPIQVQTHTHTTHHDPMPPQEGRLLS